MKTLLCGLLLGMIGGCGSQYVDERPLSGFAASTAQTVQGAPAIELVMDRIDGRCPVLSGTPTGSLNGTPGLKVDPGSAQHLEGGAIICHPPAFTFFYETQAPTFPDAEFEISDGSYTMKITYRTLFSKRSIKLLTDLSTLKPGGELRYGFGIATDLYMHGNYDLFSKASSMTTFKGESRIDMGQLVATMPTQPWVAGDTFSVAASVELPAATCEGVAGCSPASSYEFQTYELGAP